MSPRKTRSRKQPSSILAAPSCLKCNLGYVSVVKVGTQTERISYCCLDRQDFFVTIRKTLGYLFIQSCLQKVLFQYSFPKICQLLVVKRAEHEIIAFDNFTSALEVIRKMSLVQERITAINAGRPLRKLRPSR